jgi:beta-barrel assembly-enhancing protease
VTATGGGWDGRAVHLSWTHEGHSLSLTLEPDAVRALAETAPPPLAAELTRLSGVARSRERRGRLTLPMITFVFVGLPLLALLVLFLMRDRLVGAVLDRLPTAVDAQVGELVHGQVSSSGRLLTVGPEVEAVRAIGARLMAAAPAHGFTFRFEVMRDPSVNAVAAPGGVVVVHTGLLAAAETPDEIAGVLGHEITHVLERHSMRQMIFAVGLAGLVQLLVGSPEGAAAVVANAGSELTSLGFSRDQEREADRGALRLLERARLPATGLIRFFEVLKKSLAPPALLSSHPGAEDRARELTEEVRQKGEWPVEPLALDWDAVRRAAGAAR